MIRIRFTSGLQISKALRQRTPNKDQFSSAHRTAICAALSLRLLC